MPNPTYRKKMKKLVDGKMERSEFDDMVYETDTLEYRWLHNVLIWVNIVCVVPHLEMDERVKVPTNRKGLWQFLKCLSSPSPVCSYLPASCSDWILTLLSSEVPVKCDYMAWRKLENVAPIIFKLLDEMPEEHFPDSFKAVFLRLCDISKKPFEETVPHMPPVVVDKMTS